MMNQMILEWINAGLYAVICYLSNMTCCFDEAMAEIENLQNGEL